MLNLFNIILFLFLVIASTPVHELGHYFAARECNIRVLLVSLWGVPKDGKLHIQFLPKNSKVVWCIVPFSLGGQIQVENHERNSKCFKDFVYFCGAGVEANTVFGLLLIMIGASMKVSSQRIWVLGLVTALALAAYCIWKWRREFAVILFVIGYLLWHMVLITTVILLAISKITIEADTHSQLKKLNLNLFDLWGPGVGTDNIIIAAGIFSGLLCISNMWPLKEHDGEAIAERIITMNYGKTTAKLHGLAVNIEYSLILSSVFLLTGLEVVKLMF